MAKRIKHFRDKGTQDLVDLTGSQRNVGLEEPWTSCCVITFHDNQAILTSEDRNLIRQIIPHLTRNPPPQTAVDGFCDPSNQDLSDQRSNAVYKALVVAGVTPERILIGAFGDPLFDRKNRVEVLSRTSSSHDKQSLALP
ncbi:MAG: OmpA family protein [Alphaproteobacteria bacterium]|nr:OmpA family protein [Alphaproteobacteria bacterium]